MNANRTLKPVVATPESLKGYGWLIGEPDGKVRDKIDFYGKEVQVLQPADFHGNDDLCLNLVTFTRRDFGVRWMEVHTKHTQTFIPLKSHPFIMVLGKPTRLRPDGTQDMSKPDLPLRSAMAFGRFRAQDVQCHERIFERFSLL